MTRNVVVVNKKTGGRFVIPRFARCSSTERNHWRHEFNKCLRSIAMNSNAIKLLNKELVLISRFLRPSKMEKCSNLPISSKKRGRRYGVFKTGVPFKTLRASLRELFAILQIDNRPMLIRTKRARLIEAQETFLRKFVNCLEFDENNNVKGDHGPLLMHWLVQCNQETMLRLLLDRNVNMDEVDILGRTPFCYACGMGNEETVAMFIYYNVSPHAPKLVDMNGEPFGYKKINLVTAAQNNDRIIDMLIEYIYDQWSDVDTNMLLYLAVNRKSCPFAKLVEIFSSTSSINLIPPALIWVFLKTIRSSDLEKILFFFTKSKEAFDELISYFNYGNWRSYWSDDRLQISTYVRNFFEQLHVLASTVYVGGGSDEPKPSFLQAMMTKIHRHCPLFLVVDSLSFEIPIDEVESMIFVLLSNGASMDHFTMRQIFEEFDGHSDFFNFCRLLHVNFIPIPRFEYARCHHESTFYHRFPGGKTMWQIVSDPENTEAIEENIRYYLSMSSHPKVKEIAGEIAEDIAEDIADREARGEANTKLIKSLKALKARVDAQPEFPTLVELARDAARNHVIEKCRVRRSWQFYEAVKNLEIPEKLKRIVAYEINTPLYR